MFQVAEIAKLNKQEILEYEDNLKRYRDLYSTFETAKMEGEARGEIRGEKRGKIERKIEGKIEGKIEVALKLLNKGMPVEDVCDATGLSKEQVKELIKIP
jgi:predicted transposase/invertase (TIGR01784 family)